MTSYEERQAKELTDKKELYIKIQSVLKKEKINLYGFKIFICDPLDDNSRFNTDRGFFTSAYLTFKGINFGNINPDFKTTYPKKSLGQNLSLSPSITSDSFYISNSKSDVLGLINYSRAEQGLEELVIKREGCKCLQEFIDEMEKLRKEIVKFYSI